MRTTRGQSVLGEKTKVGERGRGVRRGNEPSINHVVDGLSLMRRNAPEDLGQGSAKC
jgi:hypothetical protein